MEDSKLIPVAPGYLMKKHKGIVAIDFDSTIAYSNYPNIGMPIKNSKKYINQLFEDGWYVIVWTCRDDDKNPDQPKTIAINWLQENGYKFHQINEHHPLLIQSFGNNTRKIAADIYVDDKNVFGLKSWKKIYKEINKYNPSNSILRWAEMTPEMRDFSKELEKGMEKAIWGTTTAVTCGRGILPQINEAD